MNLKIDTHPAGENTLVINLQGEVDVYTAPQLKQEIIDQLGSGANQIVVNLTGVQYLDSTGLGVLIGGLKRAREKDGELTLVCPNQRIYRIFEITGLSKIFDIYQSEDEALTSVRGSKEA